MNQQVAQLIEAMESRNATLPKMWTLSPDAARERVSRFMLPMNAGGPSMAKQFDISIPVRRGKIDASVYVPEGAGSAGLLYLHGGGFVIMSPKTHDRLARELAAGTQTRLISLDYGLAPEHPYPTAIHDAVDTIRWLQKHSAEFGIDAARLLIGGDSAGANLAVAAMLKLRDEGDRIPFRGALLIYGRYTHDETPSFRAWGDRDIVLSKQIRAWFSSHYLSRGGGGDDPYVSPLKAKLDELPPAVLVVGTLDPLLSDSEMLAEKLQQQGMPAELHVFEDGIHSFVQFPMLDMTADAIGRICAFGRRVSAA